jgi:hypothetical protein
MSLKKKNEEYNLSPKYYGPFKVLQRIGSMPYKLDFPPSLRVHPVFHVSLLKKVIRNKILAQIFYQRLMNKGKPY